MKRKSILSLITMATMSLMLTACSSSNGGETEVKDSTDTGSTEQTATDTTPSEGVTITVYEHMTQTIYGDELINADGNTYRDEDTAILKNIAEEFTAETGINVEFVGYNGARDNILPLLKVGDSNIDVFSYPGGEFTMEEVKAYVEPVMSLDEADELFGGREVYHSFENDEAGLYFWPLGKLYDNGIVYNEDVIKSVGYDAIPETHEEFVVMLEAIRDSGVTPIALHRVENWPLYTIGAFASYIDGEPGSMSKLLKYDEPFSEGNPVGDMLKNYADYKANRFFEQEVYADFGVPMNYVAEGKAGIMLFGSWVVGQIQTRVPEGTDPSVIKFDAAVDYGNGRFIIAGVGYAYGINKASDNIEESKMFLDYISKRPELAANGGFINLRTDVEPIVPELYSIIDEKIEAGTVTPIFAAPRDENFINADAVLNEADLKADEKWAGLPFDAIDMSNPTDYDAYYKQIERQNGYYKEAQEFLGVEYID